MSAQLPPPEEIVPAVQEVVALLQSHGLDRALSGTSLVTLMTIAHCDVDGPSDA